MPQPQNKAQAQAPEQAQQMQALGVTPEQAQALAAHGIDFAKLKGFFSQFIQLLLSQLLSGGLGGLGGTGAPAAPQQLGGAPKK